MDSRPILNKEGKLGILIDSVSFNTLLDATNENAKNMLSYGSSDFFEFIRSPLKTEHEELKKIVEYEKEMEGNRLKGLKIARNGSTSTIYFGYKIEDIEGISKKLYKKDEVNNDEKENILLAFIQAVINLFDSKNILVTENEILLKNRGWLESHFPGCPLNIVTLNEAVELMNLFLKHQNQYFIASRNKCNKGLWYWHFFRRNVPFYNVGDQILSSLADRFVYTLMSVDEIGIQYFLGVNNDTMDNTIYHFNYLITLVGGIFDSLAIKTKDHFNLTFDRDNEPSRTSLDNNTGHDFLVALREENRDLRTHINNYVHFISLIKNLRDVVVHRELYQKSSFNYKDEAEVWHANFIKVSEDDLQPINHLNDSQRLYDLVTNWGIYKLGEEYFIEPYTFSKIAVKKLIEFANRYLGLLGSSNFFEDLREQDPENGFLKTSDLFEKRALRFLL